ncbi:hypothetical protein KY46_06650 [Photobacterium halotolerans]|uniref:Uncharacterized protein n=1 Tax=Photobacterium halotolerans TaxID=265726 RepID=A0A0F5VG32_9GAMM|nr:hypothetical protein KY46_06650 [Photobacterium halotolerans]
MKIAVRGVTQSAHILLAWQMIAEVFSPFSKKANVCLDVSLSGAKCNSAVILPEFSAVIAKD